MAKPGITYTVTFHSNRDRDIYLDTHWPKRRMTPSPGHYQTSGAGCISVWCETVVVTEDVDPIVYHTTRTDRYCTNPVHDDDNG